MVGVGLSSIADAIHGPIDLRTPPGSGIDSIAGLLSTPAMQRLRRIKQLDFASQTYAAADHSRFAHALGSMHMMRRILNHLYELGRAPQLIRAVSATHPAALESSSNSTANRNRLTTYMMVAALLQDLGELPYGQASKHFFQPTSDLREHVRDLTGLDVSRWSAKRIFTIAAVHTSEIQAELSGLHIPFLFTLLAGQADDPAHHARLLPLFHMLDGSIDADRLDYIYRDAHHTVGALGQPNSVIESIEEYDASGPIVSDPGPASIFLANRAFLYSTVYHEPANRLRTQALLTVLRGASAVPECRERLFGSIGADNGRDLSLEDLLEMDDVLLSGGMAQLNAESRVLRRLDRHSRQALDILVGDPHGYTYFWLPASTNGEKGSNSDALPSGLFFDTMRDQASRPLYASASIRVRSPGFRYVNDLLPLEDCGGPFAKTFAESSTMLPVRDSILVFVPRDQSHATWGKFHKRLEAGSAFPWLLRHDPLGSFDLPADTRNSAGFVGRALFISFAWRDEPIVRDLVRLLHARRQRYYLLLDPYQGLGGTPAGNSKLAVEEADIVLLVASLNYANRAKDEPNGNISIELTAMHDRRVGADQMPLLVIGLDDHQALRDQINWRLLEFPDFPFIGGALRGAQERVLVSVVDEIVQQCQ